LNEQHEVYYDARARLKTLNVHNLESRRVTADLNKSLKYCM